MNERWGDLVSSTCLAGIRRATSHSEKNSMIRSSRSARTPFTVLRALCISGVWTAGVSGHLDAERTHLQKKVFPFLIPIDLPCPRLMVILARGQGSGKVDKQCSSSDVSCGGTAGSFLRLSRVFEGVLGAFCCVWRVLWRPHILSGAVGRADGPWHASTYMLELLPSVCWVPSLAWFRITLASMSRASSSGVCGGSAVGEVAAVSWVSCSGGSFEVLLGGSNLLDEEAAVKSAMGIWFCKGCACLLSSIAVISEMSLSGSSTSALASSSGRSRTIG